VALVHRQRCVPDVEQANLGANSHSGTLCQQLR
jgi:hypothetical protein